MKYRVIVSSVYICTVHRCTYIFPILNFTSTVVYTYEMLLYYIQKFNVHFFKRKISYICIYILYINWIKFSCKLFNTLI